MEKHIEAIKNNSEYEVTFTKNVINPEKWSDETPYLYRLILILKNASGKCMEVETCSVGFRQVESRDGQILINGFPVVLRGVNRHEHDHRNGKAITRETMIKDIELMKRFNFNAVRTAHYPNDPFWYDLCDKHGIYIMSQY